MAQAHFVSTAQVAQALGISVTTVKRWVDEGILPAYKTAGGHRKLFLADVLRISRQERFPHLDLNRLKLPSPAADFRALSGRLVKALREGDLPAARSLVHGSYRGGTSIETLADEVIAPAMRQVGHEWEKGRLEVLHEHRATQVCAAVLYELKAETEKNASAERPAAVGGGPEGDPYLLANLLAQMVLLDAGWDAINLGPNTPAASLHKALTEFRPRLLWLSVSHLEDAAGFARDYRNLCHKARRLGVAVAVGGRALTGEVRSELPYSTFGDGLTHLVAFARELNPPPRRPRRGRPRGS